MQQVEVRNPFTGEKQLITLDRTGHTEQKLIVALADPKLNRDQKDHALSMYLFERGAQSASMMVDLMRYKGSHTKESRVFKSQIRFDFENFVSSFISYLNRQSRLLGITLGIDIAQEKADFEKWLSLPNNEGKGYTYKDFSPYVAEGPTRVALIEMAIQSLDEAEALRLQVDRITKAREAMKGGGIYLDKQMRPYSVNDPELDDIIKAEREAEAEANKDDE